MSGLFFGASLFRLDEEHRGDEEKGGADHENIQAVGQAHDYLLEKGVETAKARSITAIMNTGSPV